MVALLSRIPDGKTMSAWATRHRGKIAGLVAGTLGFWILTTFLIVAITGVPYGGARVDPDRTTVYPNF